MANGTAALLGPPGAVAGSALSLLATFWETVKPGGKLHPAWFLEHQGHLLLEGVLCAVIAVLLLQQAYKPSKRRDQALTEKEIDALCAEWQPEPLAEPVSGPAPLEPPVVSSAVGVRVAANGAPALNMAATNFLGVPNRGELQAACRRTIEKYGVGSCGPRGFYGTIDVHLDLEEELAAFMGTEEAILYSYDLATLPSVLPAFATAADIVVCDEGMNWAGQNACTLARAQCFTFRHNDVAHLEEVLQAVRAEDRRTRRAPPPPPGTPYTA